jgi:hypothetical protein
VSGRPAADVGPALLGCRRASSRRAAELRNAPGRSPAAAQKGWPHDVAAAFWGGLKQFAGFAVALLRHLADESAYRRSLESSGRRATPAEWRRFSDARYRARFARPKCC